MMIKTYEEVNQSFKKYCDKVANDFETIIITRKDNENVVLISEYEYNNILENLYIRSNKKSYDELLKFISQLKNRD